MKILILTLPLYGNYGGVLQAYALQTILKDMGHKVYTIKKVHPENLFVKKIKTALIPLWIYLKTNLTDNHDLKRDIKGAKKQKKIKRFITKKISLSEFYLNNSSVDNKKIKRFDAIIVGSDQVWRPLYGNCLTYFLDFIENINIKKIAYAGSFGIDNLSEYSEEELNKCIILARKFDAVSVRENSGENIFKKTFNINALQVLYPTLLLETSRYTQLIEKNDAQINRKGIICYLLDTTQNKQNIISKISKIKKLSITKIEIKEDQYDQEDFIILPSISEWLHHFKNADYIITDSFHGVVFSIIFNKPFTAIVNQKRGGARFTSLLKLFELENRLVEEGTNINETNYCDIDYTKVNEIKTKWQDKSIEFLYNNLN